MTAALLDPRQHRRMLDAFGGHGALLAGARRAWSLRRDAETALEEGEGASRRDAQRGGITCATPCPSSTRSIRSRARKDSLDTRRRLMQGAERMRSDVARAAAALGLDGAEGAMSDARRWLDGVVERAEGGLDRRAFGLGAGTGGTFRRRSRGSSASPKPSPSTPAELEATEDRPVRAARSCPQARGDARRACRPRGSTARPGLRRWTGARAKSPVWPPQQRRPRRPYTGAAAPPVRGAGRGRHAP